MGDTGSLALGGIIAVFAIAIRKELLIPVFCGVFLIENLVSFYRLVILNTLRKSMARETNFSYVSYTPSLSKKGS